MYMYVVYVYVPLYKQIHLKKFNYHNYLHEDYSSKLLIAS